MLIVVTERTGSDDKGKRDVEKRVMVRSVISSAILLLALALSSCGGGSGGGSTSGSLPPSRPAGKISGTAFDGLVVGGDVAIYDFSNGTKGALLGTAITDGNGLYSVSIVSTDKPILIEITNGFYIEEASGIQIQLDTAQGHKLLAVQLYQSGMPVTSSATFFTTLATGLAQYFVHTQGLTVTSAILTANQQISAWAGFDIEKTTPRDVVNPANTAPFLSDGLRYGFVSAAISELTQQVHVAAGQAAHSTWPSIAFVQKAYDDIRADGVLDGQGASGALSLGGLPLNGDVYRATLAERMLQFVVGGRNNTSLAFDDVLPFATSFDHYTDALFGNQTARDIRMTAPTVNQFLPAEGDVISGSYNANALVSDAYGIAQVQYFVDGNFVATAGSPTEPVRAINTLNFANGTHAVSIHVTNLMGNTTVVTHNVTIANGSVSVGVPAYVRLDDLGSNYACVYNVAINDGAGVGIASVVQNGISVATQLPHTTTLQLSVATGASSACVGVAVTAVDNLGSSNTRRFGAYFSTTGGGRLGPLVHHCSVGAVCT